MTRRSSKTWLVWDSRMMLELGRGSAGGPLGGLAVVEYMFPTRGALPNGGGGRRLKVPERLAMPEVGSRRAERLGARQVVVIARRCCRGVESIEELKMRDSFENLNDS